MHDRTGIHAAALALAILIAAGPTAASGAIQPDGHDPEAGQRPAPTIDQDAGRHGGAWFDDISTEFDLAMRFVRHKLVAAWRGPVGIGLHDLPTIAAPVPDRRPGIVDGPDPLARPPVR